MATDLEVFRATVAHRRPERVLYYFKLTEDLQRRVVEHIGQEDFAASYGLFEPVTLTVKRPEGVARPDYSRYWQDEDLPEGTTFSPNGVARVPSGFYHFFGYISPLRNATSLAEIENYPLDEMDDWDFSPLTAQVDAAHAAGRVVYGGVGHIYETAWQIRGYEQFLVDMIERPVWAQCLLDRLAHRNMVRAVAFTEAGADVIHCGDDVANQKAMMFAPAMWREMMLSRWREIWQRCKGINPDVKVWYHSDGNIFEVIGELIDAGVDILNPLQPECLDVDRVHRQHGDRITLDGCMGTQSTMPWGSPDDVRWRVKDVIARYGRSGGLIVSPTHVLEPEVPIANIEAMCDACREFPAVE